jgi:hypothetical protein
MPTVNVAVLHENVPLVPVTNTLVNAVEVFEIVPEIVTGIPAYKDTAAVEHEKLPVLLVIPVTVNPTPTLPVYVALLIAVIAGLPVTLVPDNVMPTVKVPVVELVGVSVLPTTDPVPLEIIPFTLAVLLVASIPETVIGCPTANPFVKVVQVN